jgi:hypothetical protein
VWASVWLCPLGGEHWPHWSLTHLLTEGPPPLDHWEDIFFAFLGSFISILAIAVINKSVGHLQPSLHNPQLCTLALKQSLAHIN